MGEDRLIYADLAYAEEYDEDGSDCWISHEGLIRESAKGLCFRIKGDPVWLPRSQIVSQEEARVQVTPWLKQQRKELFV